MTREEASNILDDYDVNFEGHTAEEIAEAFEVAFRALEQEPCEDAISRQAVLESIKNLYPDMPVVDIMGSRRKWLDKYAPYFECENAVEHLPPVNSQPKTGHWEWVQYDYNPKIGNWHCSKCRSVVVEGVSKEEKGGIPLYKYCPQCGAKMSEIPTGSELQEREE